MREIIISIIALIEFWILIIKWKSKKDYIKMKPEEVKVEIEKAKKAKQEFENKLDTIVKNSVKREQEFNILVEHEEQRLIDYARNLKQIKKDYEKEAQKEVKQLKKQIDYLQSLCPVIEDEADTDESDIEFINEYLSKEEYEKLSDTERNKLALERYQKRKKAKWEIGRDFEMYIGYKFKQEKYDVQFCGIEKKFEDMGRDLIIKDKENLFVVQCKYWSKTKLIHEKHLCQLYGTTVMFNYQNNKNAKPLFISHCKLSETAKKFAEALNIIVYENVELGEYPLIKCNLKDGIYHLPFDQQYDTFKDKNCYYAWTIEEAENKGCRRAYKWHG